MGISESSQLRSGVKSLSLTGELIEKLLDRFSHFSDSFGFTRDEVKMLYRPKNEQMDLIFNIFDSAKRDKIDAFEFIAGMIIISEASLKVKARKLFSLYDFDHSRSITFDELIIMLRTAMNSLCYMTSTNPWSIEKLVDHTQKLFAKIDTNNDKTISLAEWTSFITRDVEVVKILEKLELITSEDKRPNWGTENDPEMDSDFENETYNKEWDRSEVHERVKAGVESLEESPFVVENVGEGDQFLAVKPWEGVVKNSVPTNYKPNKSDSNSPDACLSLEYIHGYRCHDVRNNLRYTAEGEVIYHTAAVGVVLNANNVQKHFMAHTDDITAFDVSPDGKLAVTGEVGKIPTIHVWSTSSMETIKTFKGIIKRGVTNIAFSQDATRIAAIGADNDHCIAVYDIYNPGNKTGAMQHLVATGKGGKDTFLDIRFHPSSNDKLIICGVKVFAVVTLKAGALTVKKGTGWGKTPLTQLQALSCISFIGEIPVTGAFNGTVFKWEDGVLKEAVKVHESSIAAIGKWENGIITGGNDGIVNVLDGNLKVVKSIQLKELQSVNPKPRSVWGANGKVLIGTRGGEIFEVGEEQVKLLMSGHYDMELWGLANHPSLPRFASFGQDSLLAVWDLNEHKQIRHAKLESPGETVAYSPSGDSIAVGLQNGKVLILDAETLEVKVGKHDRVKGVSQIKYSPDGSILAAGGHDSIIITYLVNENYKLQYKMKGHSAAITHLDFSEAGAVIQSTSLSYELLYHNLSKGLHDPKGASANKDDAWNTWSCILGWPVQGIWPPCSDGSDINAVRRSKSRKVLATCDDFSQVKLFKYPCPVKNSACNTYRGHSSHVTNCVFFDNYLVTTGGNDKSIFVWKYTEDDQETQDMDTEGLQALEAESSLFKFETVGEGDQFLAVKPWLGEMKASTPKIVVPKNQGKAPEATLTLTKVHGYRGYDTRNNLKFTSSGKVVFPAAGLGVIMNIESKAQEYFTMHDDDVVSIAIHPGRKIAATGQTAHVGKSTKIDLFVWDTETHRNLACLTGFHRRAIRYLDFSPNGNLILSVGDDDDHSLAVYDWQANRMVCNSKVDKDTVLGVSFISNSDFVVYGAKFIKFFSMAGTNVTSNRGITGGASFEGQMAGALFNGLFHTGTHAGNLFVWEQKALKKSIPIHSGQVWAMCVHENHLLTGGSEGLIYTLDADYNKIKQISLVEYSVNPGVRAIDIMGDLIIAGTRGCEILKIAGDQVEVVQRGHYDGELWGLAVSPNKLEFATCGGDKTLRVWDIPTGNMLRATPALATDLRAIDWSPDGKYIAAGHVNANIVLFNETDLANVCSVQSSFKGKDCWVEDLKFSPDGSKLAFGAHGCASKVEVFTVDAGKLIKHCIINVGITSALTHIDWSVDSSLVCVNSEAYELKFVSLDQRKNVASSSVKDVKWNSYTCTFGWSVQYIWPECADGSDINSVHKAKNSNLLVTADDFGKINLFRWPVCVEKQGSKSYTGHSAHVTKVKFTHDDSYIVSIGGDDKCIFVWKTEIPAEAEIEEPLVEEVSVEVAQVKKVDTGKQDRKERAAVRTAHVPVARHKPAESIDVRKPVKKEEATAAVKGGKNTSEGALKAPSTYIKASRNQNLAPAVNLSLEFVHGYRAKDCRNNIKYLPSGKLVYHAAAVGIVFDLEEFSQSFFVGHNDDITSFALSPNKDLVATGEVGRKPTIFVWDSNSLTQIAKFNAPLEKGIGALAFSPSGNLLVAIAMDDDHNIALYNLQTNSLIVSTKGDREKILEVAFLSENEFVTTGIKHYKIWTLNGNKITGRRGQFGKNDNLLLSLAVNGDEIYTGTGAGTVVKWKGGEAEATFEMHGKGTDSLWINDQFIVSGGKDGFVHICSKDMTKVHTFDLNTEAFDSVFPSVRAAALNDDNTKLVIGTFASEIYEVDIETKEVKNLVRGHYAPSKGNAVTNEVWGLSIINQNSYATCSDDGTLRIWNIESKKQERVLKFGKEEGGDSTRARCVTANDKYLAVGFLDGNFKVFTHDLVQVHAAKDRKEEISDIKFSPDGTRLAVGSHDNFIDIYSTEDFKRVGICKGHSSFITHFDWSTDSAFIHSNCGAYELLFWEANGKQVTGGATQLKDEEWYTWSVVIGWPVQGVYPPYADGTDINAVDRSKKKFGNNEYQLIASADDFGMVKLLRYPCLDKKSESVVGKGHCSHVTNVRFAADDTKLVSVGGDDQCVFQWTVSNKN